MDGLNNNIDTAQRVIGEMEEKSEDTQGKETKTQERFFNVKMCRR